jgi:hypothetical protein
MQWLQALRSEGHDLSFSFAGLLDIPFHQCLGHLIPHLEKFGRDVLPQTALEVITYTNMSKDFVYVSP